MAAVARGRDTVGGVPDLLDHHSTGLLVPSAQAAPLVAAILQLLGDPDLASALARSAAAQAEVRFAPARLASDMDALYTELLHAYDVPPPLSVARGTQAEPARDTPWVSTEADPGERLVRGRRSTRAASKTRHNHTECSCQPEQIGILGPGVMNITVWDSSDVHARPKARSRAAHSSSQSRTIQARPGLVVEPIVIGLEPVLLPGFESPPPDTTALLTSVPTASACDTRRHRDVGVTRRRGERIRASARPRCDDAGPAGARERGNGQARRRRLRHGDGTACRRARRCWSP